MQQIFFGGWGVNIHGNVKLALNANYQTAMNVP